MGTLGVAGASLWSAAVLLLSAASPAAPQHSVRIAVIGKSQANLLFAVATLGAEDEARALSRSTGTPIEIVGLTPAQEDADTQVERVRRAVSDGVQAILVSCSDSAKLTPAIDDAVDKGVAVMTFDSDAPASKRFAFYGIDDADLGERLMTELADELHGKGKIAVLAGNPEARNLKARVDGVRKVAARHPGIEIVDVVHHAERPQDAATAVLQENARVADLAGWAMVGGWPLYRSSQTPRLIDDLGQRKLKIVAVGALPDQLYYVDHDLVPVLWGQPVYLWGKVGVETIVDKLVGHKPVPERIRMEPVKINRASLGAWARQLKEWGFSGIPDEYLAAR